MNMSVGKTFDPPWHLNLREVSKSLHHRDESERLSVTKQIEIDEHKKQDTQLSTFPQLLHISQLTAGITFNREKESLCITVALCRFRTKMRAEGYTVLFFVLRVQEGKGDDTVLS